MNLLRSTLATRVAKRLFGLNLQPVTHFGVFSSFNEASIAAGQSYEASKKAKSHVTAWDREIPEITVLPRKTVERLVHYFAFFALPFGDGPRTPARVLDFGGGNGSYGRYLEAFKVLAPGSTWDVVDLPEVCAKQVDTELVRFHTDVPAALGSCTHLVLGAVLQILHDPEEVLLRLVSELQPTHILITHYPQHDGDHAFATVSRRQNRRSKFPYWVFSDSDIFRLLGDRYRILSVPTPHFSGRHESRSLTFQTLFLSWRAL